MSTPGVLLGHATARDLLIARMGIEERRRSLIAQLQECDEESIPYDEAIVEMVGTGRDVHLEFAESGQRYTIAVSEFGGVVVTPACLPGDLALPGAAGR